MAKNEKYYETVFDTAVEEARKKGALGIVFRNFDSPGSLSQSKDYPQYKELVDLIKVGKYAGEAVKFYDNMLNAYIIVPLKEDMSKDRICFLKKGNADMVVSAKTGEIETAFLMPILF